MSTQITHITRSLRSWTGGLHYQRLRLDSGHEGQPSQTIGIKQYGIIDHYRLVIIGLYVDNGDNTYFDNGDNMW